MRILITGAQGFIGKNTILHLKEQNRFSVLTFCRNNSLSELFEMVEMADAVIHLAGENRPKDISAFEKVNVQLTKALCDTIREKKQNIPFVFASSIQVHQDNPYGKSKLDAEKAVEALHKENGNSVYIYRLPNVFGKWCKPNYNSVVATFCYNIMHDLPIQINDASARLRLVYVDDVVTEFIRVLKLKSNGISMPEIEPEYAISLGGLAEQIQAFKSSRESLFSEPVGKGLCRALYATYVSYLAPDKFSYHLPRHEDDRGAFVEVLKTNDSGQFSFFTVRPGATRGGHYHHSKSEKFLVVKGTARFRFRDVLTDETYEILTNSDTPQVVDTVPGWVHNITNVGDDEMVVMLWANEFFDNNRPDTVPAEV